MNSFSKEIEDIKEDNKLKKLQEENDKLKQTILNMTEIDS